MPTNTGYVAEGYVTLGYTVYTSISGAVGVQQQVARIGDPTYGVCRIHGNQNGHIVAGSENVFVNGIGIARIGDLVQADCGHTGIIASGAEVTFANGNLIARVNDHIEGIYTASILSGSANVFNGR